MYIDLINMIDIWWVTSLSVSIAGEEELGSSEESGKDWDELEEEAKRGECLDTGLAIDTLRLRQNGRRFPDDIFKCIFLNENVWITIRISLKFVSRGPSNNIPALVQIVAWHRSGDKPLSEPMMVILLTHICVLFSWVFHYNLRQVIFKLILTIDRLEIFSWWGFLDFSWFPGFIRA